MHRAHSLLLLLAVAIGGGASVPISAAEPDQVGPARQDDPVEPARPVGFERRDIEDMDRRIEERRQRWRDEQDAIARAKKARKREAERAAPQGATDRP